VGAINHPEGPDKAFGSNPPRDGHDASGMSRRRPRIEDNGDAWTAVLAS